MWLAYRTPDNKIFLGQRHKHNADNVDCKTEYNVIDLSCNPATMAKSVFPPALCGFNDKMYLAWKPEEPNVIKYQRTDGSLRFDPKPPLTVPAENIVAGPVLARTSTTLYLSWLAGPARCAKPQHALRTSSSS